MNEELPAHTLCIGLNCALQTDSLSLCPPELRMAFGNTVIVDVR